jgi:hypothetical protein
MTSVTDVIPTYVPCFQPYYRIQDGRIMLVLPDIEGRMVNLELTVPRHAKLMQDGLVVSGEIVARVSPQAT